MRAAEPPHGPLSGVRVLDLTSVVMGPLATQTLGDLGADVLTIETPTGDINRTLDQGPHQELSGTSLNLLRNKRNVALDLKHPDGRAALLRIAATCEVFVTNLRPAPLARLGLTYEEIARVRPDVIFCQAGGFPSDSAKANEPAYDDVIQAAAGVLDAACRAEGTPAMSPTLLADKVCGLVMTYAIIAALFHRERTGEGQRIEVPMVDVMTAFMLVEHGAAAISGRGAAGLPLILTPPRRPLRTKDGWVTVLPYREEHLAALLCHSGVEDLLDGVRHALTPPYAGLDLAFAALAKAVAAKPTAEWLTFCARRGIPAAEIGDLDAIVEALPDREHPVAGPYKSIPAPVRFDRSPASVRRHAPLIGEHNREVLAEVGLPEDTITRLETTGVLRTGQAGNDGS